MTCRMKGELLQSFSQNDMSFSGVENTTCRLDIWKVLLRLEKTTRRFAAPLQNDISFQRPKFSTKKKKKSGLLTFFPEFQNGHFFFLIFGKFSYFDFFWKFHKFYEFGIFFHKFSNRKFHKFSILCEFS